MPPITSATRAIDGSSLISAKSVVSTPSPAGNVRERPGSRTSARTTRMRCPVARSISSPLSLRRRWTASPTVPYPSNATGTSTAPIPTPAGGMFLDRHRVLGELEPVVEDADGPLDLGGPDDAGDADRRRRDDLDVDARLGERVEHVGDDAWVRLHPRADKGDLCDLSIGREALPADVCRDVREHGLHP